MRVSFKYYVKLNKLRQEIIEELSYHTTKLYNIANYDNRKNGFKEYVDAEKMYKDNYHTQFLHSHNYQWCLKMLEQNWKSYFKSIKNYKANPIKYLGLPKPPKFKNSKNKKNEVIFTTAGIRYSAIDLEEINKANYNKNRRITRGLFKTNSGMLINADINGALNILRRYTKCIPKAVQAVRDNGRLDSPLRIRIA